MPPGKRKQESGVAGCYRATASPGKVLHPFPCAHLSSCEGRRHAKGPCLPQRGFQPSETPRPPPKRRKVLVKHTHTHDFRPQRKHKCFPSSFGSSQGSPVCPHLNSVWPSDKHQHRYPPSGHLIFQKQYYDRKQTNH